MKRSAISGVRSSSMRRWTPFAPWGFVLTSMRSVRLANTSTARRRLASSQLSRTVCAKKVANWSVRKPRQLHDHLGRDGGALLGGARLPQPLHRPAPALRHGREHRLRRPLVGIRGGVREARQVVRPDWGERGLVVVMPHTGGCAVPIGGLLVLCQTQVGLWFVTDRKQQKKRKDHAVSGHKERGFLIL
jgi:hypothetical protein